MKKKKNNSPEGQPALEAGRIHKIRPDRRPGSCRLVADAVATSNMLTASVTKTSNVGQKKFMKAKAESQPTLTTCSQCSTPISCVRYDTCNHKAKQLNLF